MISPILAQNTCENQALTENTSADILQSQKPANKPDFQKEWEASGVHPGIISLNVWEPDKEDVQEFILGEKLEEEKLNNPGQVSANARRLLDRYAHITEGGWACEGVDPATGEAMGWGCFKPAKPRTITEGKGEQAKEKLVKYEAPPGQEKRVFCLRVTWEIGRKIAANAGLEEEYLERMGDDSPRAEDKGFWPWAVSKGIKQHYVEGAKKAGLLLTLGYLAIGLDGVENWSRTRADKTEARQLKPDILALIAKQPEVEIVHDKDSKPSTRHNVDRATTSYAAALEQAGCTVTVAQWNPKDGKGIDDVWASGGENMVLEALANAVPWQEIGERVSGKNHWTAPSSWQGEIGFWSSSDAGSQFHPRTNFDFQIGKVLEDPSRNGDSALVLLVKRPEDAKQREVLIKSSESIRLSDFLSALSREFGGEVVCNLKIDELKSLLRVRLREYFDRGGKAYRLAARVGRQEDGFWIFPSQQFAPDGQPCTEADSGWIHNPLLSSGDDVIPNPDIAAPGGTEALGNLVDCLGRFMGHESIAPVLFCLGWGVAALHFEAIIKRERRFPILNAVGDPGSLKTIAAEATLSLGGNHHNLISKSSESALYERLKRTGSIPQCIDDPKRDRDTDELLKRLYNAEARVLRGVYQKPQSPVMATSNHALGDDQPATLSRLCQIHFHKPTGGDSSAWDDLQAAMNNASSALPHLIALGYPAAEVRELANKMRPHLSQAHARVADSLALCLYYSRELLALAGHGKDSELRQILDRYAVELCQAANDSETNKSSLDDFLDKLEALHSMGKVGGWNVRAVLTQDDEQYLAIYMPGVWPEFDSTFSPAYSRRLVESAALKAGGRKGATQKFYRSQPEAVNYHVREPEKVSRKCLLVPCPSEEMWKAIQPPAPDTISLPPLPPVTSPLPQKGNGQNPEPEQVSAVVDPPVTFLKNVEPLENSPSPQNPEPQETLISEKKVTSPSPEAESQSQSGTQPLPFLGNEQVTGGNGGNAAPQHPKTQAHVGKLCRYVGPIEAQHGRKLEVKGFQGVEVLVSPVGAGGKEGHVLPVPADHLEMI